MGRRQGAIPLGLLVADSDTSSVDCVLGGPALLVAAGTVASTDRTGEDMAHGTCSVDGCGRVEQLTRGWCKPHYERWRRNGVPGPPGDARRTPLVACSVDDCDTITRGGARGWCAKHYLRWQKYGDPTFTMRPNYGEGRRMHQRGYVMLWMPGHPMAQAFGYVLEHRYVVHEAGIEVPDGFHVHHLNHVKTDNRLENLAVMSASAHRSHHMHPGAIVKNQYGQWVVGEKRKAA